MTWEEFDPKIQNGSLGAVGGEACGLQSKQRPLHRNFEHVEKLTQIPK
jgi:hypothetical protein